MRKITRTTALVLTAAMLVGTLAAAEAVCRLVLPAPWLYPRDPPEDALMRPHPVRGYALRPGLRRRWVRPDFSVQVQTNRDGLRDADLALSRRAALRVLAVGDSYTFGIGVEAADTWPEQLERLLGGPDMAAVVNTGVPGYSARQMRQAAEEFWPAVQPQVVIAGLYANSFWRVRNPYMLHGGTLVTTQEAAAVEVLPDGDLVTTAYPRGTVLREVDVFLKRYSHFGAHLLSLLNRGRHWAAQPPKPMTDAAVRLAYAPALEELSVLAQFARARNARLIVLAINAQQEDGSFLPEEWLYNTILREHCVRAGISFVDPLPELVARGRGEPWFRHRGDAHWTRAAHEIAARQLAVLLRAGMYGAP